VNNNGGHSPVFDLVSDGTRLIEAIGGGGGACTAQNPTTGATLWSVHSNGNLQSVQIFGSDVYCGGHFSGTASFGGQTRKKLAEVDLATGAIQPFAPVVNSALGVWSLGSDATHLFVGGDFTKITGVAQPHFAMFTSLGSQTAPLAPVNLTAEGGDSAAFLAWSPPSSDGGAPITTYQVYRATGGGSLAKIGTSKTTSYTDSTAVNGTTYTYAVAATNSVGTGPQSNTATATPVHGSTTVPGAPTGLTATGGSGDVQLTWTPPANDGHSPITSYQDLRSTKTGTETALATIGATTSYDDTAVTVGTTYFYKVKAINSVGAGPVSNEASASSAAGVPAAPVLSGTAGVGSITLTWTVPNNGGSPITKYSLVKDGVRLTNPKAGTTSYVDMVPSGQTHSYQIKAINAVGASKYSNTVTVKAK
jgi:fibronectin type 3 domain-containing protein